MLKCKKLRVVRCSCSQDDVYIYKLLVIVS